MARLVGCQEAGQDGQSWDLKQSSIESLASAWSSESDRVWRYLRFPFLQLFTC
jgi:hypothetical protein